MKRRETIAQAGWCNAPPARAGVQTLARIECAAAAWENGRLRYIRDTLLLAVGLAWLGYSDRSFFLNPLLVKG